MSSLTIGEVARVCHEANRALQVIQADPANSVNPAWDDLDSETRASAVHGVVGVLDGQTPEQSHENWSAFKRERGWVYGPTKDEQAKTHPLLVPYADLDDAAKIKDALFVAIVKTLVSL